MRPSSRAHHLELHRERRQRAGCSGHRALGCKALIEDTGSLARMFRSCRCEAAVDSRTAADLDLGMQALDHAGNRRFVVVHTGRAVADYTGHTEVAVDHTEVALHIAGQLVVLRNLAAAEGGSSPEVVDPADSSGRIEVVHSQKALERRVAGRMGTGCRGRTLRN